MAAPDAAQAPIDVGTDAGPQLDEPDAFPDAVDAHAAADSGPIPDSGPRSMLPPLQKPDQSTAADFACRPSEPVGSGQSVSALFELRELQTDDPVRRAQVFADNMRRDFCNAPECQLVTTDMNGMAMVNARAAQWFAYVVQPPPGAEWGYSVQYNETAPAADRGTIVGTSFSVGFLNTFPALLGIRQEPGLAMLIGTIQDCAGDPIRGAIARVYSGSTEIVEGVQNGDPHFCYFDASLGLATPPDPVTGIGTHTDIDGIYAVLNVPPPSPSTQPIRIEAWGRRDAGDEYDSLLGCEAAQVLADGVTIVNIAPLRSDYPVSHPCATR